MPTPWSVPKIWPGETAAILASGPSLSADVAAAVRGKCRVIAVNNVGIDCRRRDGTFVPAMAPWADVLYASDAKWWYCHAQQALKFQGLKVSCGQNAVFPAILSLSISGVEGFDERPTHIRTGMNSGYAAVHVAAHFGARRILLLGFDMQGSHYFGDHPKELHSPSPYSSFIRFFGSVAPEYRRRGVEIINCTPGSALKCFPRQSLQDALCMPAY